MTPRWLVSLCIALCAGGSALAAAKAVFPEKIYEAGDVQLGNIITHEFVIKNEGDVPFKITEVRPSCHCTVPEYPPEVGAGKSGKILIKIDTKGLPTEPLSKNVTVATDAPGGERTVLAVNFNLSTPLEFVPNALVYIYQKTGESKEQQVLARPHIAGMKILSATSNNPNILVTLSPVKAEAAQANAPALRSLLLPREGDAWILIRVSDRAPAGTLKADVVVRTSDSKNPEGTISVRAKVEDPAAAN